MRMIKDGGAAIAVEQATNIGAQITQLIIEILLELLFRRNSTQDESQHIQYLKVINDILKELTMMRDSLKADTLEGRSQPAEPMTPAEKVFGRSFEEPSASKERFAQRNISRDCNNDFTL